MLAGEEGWKKDDLLIRKINTGDGTNSIGQKTCPLPYERVRERDRQAAMEEDEATME